jgi:hypothetical protein
MAQHDNRICGHNDAIYDVMPKEDQALKIEFLEIAPTPFKIAPPVCVGTSTSEHF